MYVISGVGWVVKLLMEDWTNRLNKYGSILTFLIYAGSRDVMFWVSAAAAKAGILIDRKQIPNVGFFFLLSNIFSI